MTFRKITRREALGVAGAVVIGGCKGETRQPAPVDESSSSGQALMNRIFFPGNPWPNGHGIKALVWSARLDPDVGLWFDLHLESEDYYAEDGASESDDDEEQSEDPDGWDSRLVWNNYRHCTLSSTLWGHQGFLAATRDQPLDFATLAERPFNVDPLPPPDDSDDRAFGIYLLGHDGVAEHQIQFTPSGLGGHYGLNWRGKIAQEYIGSEMFDHTFHAGYDGLRFSGIQFPANTMESNARSLLTSFVLNIGALKSKQEDGLLWLAPA